MKDNQIHELVLLEKPSKTMKVVVALTQPKYLHPACAVSE